MKTLKIALIGSGLTMEEHVRALKGIKKYKFILSGVYSRQPKNALKLKKKFKIKKVFKSIDEMYKETKADIVIVVISAENVKKIILKTARYNWKIFTEKPLGINFIETLDIKKKINFKLKHIFIALNRLYYQSTISALDFIKKDKSKRIINIYDQEKIYQNKILSKNLMYTNSVHLFCFCQILARGKLKKIITIKKTRDYLLKELIFTSGDVIFFHSIWNRPFPWKIEISLKNFFLILSPLEKLFIRNSNSNKFFEIKKDNDDKKYKPGFKKQLENFLDKTLNNTKKYNFDYYFEVVKIIKAYYD
ncbi:Gfo/Idh/MocA family oxidoreductase [Candidatus Pelagibacter sp.]|nr:Gfo/Idh/MocA family oxidoreductase [Candidatus Pelagibacter sp.]|tara:strand:+ start:73 stop:987 length:915 start_codon:yes stop_codon:yes gene_type:complete